MSFDINSQFFKKRTFAKFDRNIAWKIFEPFAHVTASGNWDLYQGDRFLGTLHLDDTPQIAGLGINRPGGMAYDLLYEVAHQVGLTIYWENRVVVTDPKIIDEIPSFFSDHFSPPRVVRSGQQILNYLLRDDPEADPAPTPANIP